MAAPASLALLPPRHDAAPTAPAQQRLLLDLIFEQKLPAVQQLAAQFPTLDFVEATRQTSPLLLAVDASSAAVIEWLLEQGADPNFADAHTLPLLLAIERSVYNDIYCTDTGDWAAKEDETALVELLLDYGADFLLPDPRGESACDYARQHYHAAAAVFAARLAGRGT